MTIILISDHHRLCVALVTGQILPVRVVEGCVQKDVGERLDGNMRVLGKVRRHHNPCLVYAVRGSLLPTRKELSIEIVDKKGRHQSTIETVCFHEPEISPAEAGLWLAESSWNPAIK